jgi:hypothetical protein
MAQTLSCPVPNSLDYLTLNGFQLSIAKLPGVAYFCQEATLPSLSLPNLGVKTPLSEMHFAGTNLEYGDLEVSFLIDSKMDNYAAMLGWMTGLGFPESYEQYTDFVRANSGAMSPRVPDYSAGTLIILGTNNRPLRSVEFVDLLPQSITSMTFTTTAGDVKYIGAKAVFKYDYFKLI